jgi:hypothetical protein
MGCLARPPSGTSPEFWRIASDSPLYLSRYRPNVSISRELPQALASSGILLPRGIRLAPTLRSDRPRRGPHGVTPFPASIARILRAVLSTGFIGSAYRSMSKVAGALSCVSLTPASQPLALVDPSRWLNHTFTFAAHRCLLDGIPGLRLPGVRRLTPLQTVEDQSRVWGLRFHSCTGRKGLAPSWKTKLRG